VDFIAVSESMDVEGPEGEVWESFLGMHFLKAWFESERRASACEPSEIQDGTRVATIPTQPLFGSINPPFIRHPPPSGTITVV
jgi:hypothetical protein